MTYEDDENETRAMICRVKTYFVDEVVEEIYN